MVYKNNFIVVVKHKGKVLRDIREVVTLPFGAEYSILLKNKGVRTAVASVEVDGVDALDGNEIIVPADDSVELKGFMRGRKVRNRFKFIEKTAEISKFRGDRAEDGLIRVEYKFEVAPKNDYILYRDNHNPYWMDRDITIGSSFKSSRRVNFDVNTTTVYNCCADSNIDGITVDGSKTKQDFTVGNVGLLGEANVIILKLQGKSRVTGKLVKKPLTVKTKKQCTSCGRKWRSSNTFCGKCGTYLHN